MRVGAIVQARCGSSRFPNKVLLKLPFHGATNVLQHIAKRVALSRRIDQYVIATTDAPEDDQYGR